MPHQNLNHKKTCRKIYQKFFTSCRRLPICNIRSFEERDLEDLKKLQGDKAVMQFVGTGEVRDAARVEIMHKNLMQLWKDFNPIGGYIVCDKATGKFLGMAALEPVFDQDQKIKPGEAEIMLYFQPEFWGQKYGKEVGQGFLNCLLASHQEGLKMTIGGAPLTKLVATAHPDNAGSIALQKSLGFKQQDTIMMRKGDKEVTRITFEFDLRAVFLAPQDDSKPTSNPSAKSTECLLKHGQQKSA